MIDQRTLLWTNVEALALFSTDYYRLIEVVAAFENKHSINDRDNCIC